MNITNWKQELRDHPGGSRSVMRWSGCELAGFIAIFSGQADKQQLLSAPRVTIAKGFFVKLYVVSRDSGGNERSYQPWVVYGMLLVLGAGAVAEFAGISAVVDHSLSVAIANLPQAHKMMSEMVSIGYGLFIPIFW